MTVIHFGKPLPIHIPFHMSDAKYRVAFGAVGSGKSYAGCDEAIKWCLQYPGIEGMITRKTAPELRDTTERVFASRMPPELWNWSKGALRKAGGHFESFTFPNGSRVLFRSIDDWMKHKSLNLGFIFYDEMSEFDEDTFHGMRTRLRQTELTPEAYARGYRDPISRRGAWGATNPNGHDWVYKLAHPESADRLPETAAFFSTTLDNPFLPPDYIDDLLRMPRQYVLRFVLCRFDDFAGRIYEHFGQPGTIVPHPQFDPQRAGPVVWMGMDPGTSNPTAGVWAHIDLANHRMVAIAEYKEPGLAVDTHVARWRQIEAMQRMRVQWRVGDPNSITQRDRGTALALQQQYGRLGYHFALGSADQDTRIWQLGRLINLNRFVVSEDLTQLTEALANYQWKDLTPAQKNRGEDPRQAPLKKNTDLVEAAQFIAGRYLPLPNKPYKPEPQTWSDEVWAEVHKQQDSRRMGGGAATNELGIPI